MTRFEWSIRRYYLTEGSTVAVSVDSERRVVIVKICPQKLAGTNLSDDDPARGVCLVASQEQDSNPGYSCVLRVCARQSGPCRDVAGRIFVDGGAAVTFDIRPVKKGETLYDSEIPVDATRPQIAQANCFDLEIFVSPVFEFVEYRTQRRPAVGE